MHNEKVKDECLKKVLVYKDKYLDYKTKVKRANQQLTILAQRLARYEVEKGIRAGQGMSSKKVSPGKSGQGASDDQADEYDEEEAYEEEEQC